MCGIVGSVSQRNVTPILLEGLRRLEYRGYDSSGLAVIKKSGTMQQIRRVGKVSMLSKAIDEQPVVGNIGIAHTRWATHGEPNEQNAHPHLSSDQIAVVHNGIIENYEELRDDLQQKGYVFLSDTDTEVIAHLIYHENQQTLDLVEATKKAVSQLRGAYAIVVTNQKEPDRLVVARLGSPLVIGLGFDENFIASDQLALQLVTNRFIFLEDGDIAEVFRDHVSVFDQHGVNVTRAVVENNTQYSKTDKGSYRHFMLKEIHEQSEVINQTLEGRLINNQLNLDILGKQNLAKLKQVKSVQIVACGTSYHAALVARYWFEEIAGIACRVEIASEFRYRQFIVPENCLFVTISQSGETADTLAALKLAKQRGYMASLSICNVSGSTIVRESDMVLFTRAGVEIGVASTKAFTTQLVVLFMLVIALGKNKKISNQQENEFVRALKSLPKQINQVLKLSDQIKDIAENFAHKHHCLFLGRGSLYPIAMEGSLKLKEISYIHAEAYAAGELKHGPLALVDGDMPVIVVAPNNNLLEKLKANMEEVRARGGELYVFADKTANWQDSSMHIISVDKTLEVLAPIVYTIPLQLLSYYVAVIKGTDVDQPRNLAKSVTVE